MRAEHGTYDEDHVDKSAAERFQIGRCRGITTDGLRAVKQPGVHRDRGTVVRQRRFVVLVDEVVVEQVEVTICSLLAIHFFETVAEQTTVEADEVALGNFSDEGRQVLVFYIGVRIELRASSCIGGVAVVHQEAEFLQCLAIFSVLIAINDKCLCSGEEALSHESHFHLVLNFLYTHVVGEEQTTNEPFHLCGAE